MPLSPPGFPPEHPVGVFDSGIGGLSIVRSLIAQLPGERFVYLSDSAHAPYGERSETYVIDRALAVTEQLRQLHGIKALVVACNTATAAAIAALRAAHPDWPIVGVEPALKPALAVSQTRHIGVMATRRTVESEKFQRLLASLQEQAVFHVQACDGLARAIEAQDQTETQRLVMRYTELLGSFGTSAGSVDTLVLGCTHYPLEAALIQSTVGPAVSLLDPGVGVARQLERRLAEGGLAAPAAHTSPLPAVTWRSTGDSTPLHRAVARWMPSQCR